jgi:uncharacterized membrane protein
MKTAAPVLLGAALFAATYIALDLNKLYALYFGIDNGIFLQTLAHIGTDGSAFNWAERRSHFLVHDSWLLYALVPLVKAYPYQQTLIVVQVLLVASSALVLYAFARVVGVTCTAASLLALAYLISPSVQGFAYNDFSEAHFEPLLIFALAIAVAKRSLVWTLVFAQLLLGLKEDVALFLIWFGLAGAIWYDRRLGVSVAALALLNGAAYAAVVAAHGQVDAIPHYGWRLLYPAQDTAFLIEILSPFAFAPIFLGWRMLIALPLVAELGLAMNRDGFPMARAGTHYTEPLVALCAVGAALVLRSRPVLAPYAIACSTVMALAFNTTVLHIGRHLYVARPAEYAQAVGLVRGQRKAVFAIEEQGRWAVAAGDLRARIDGFGKPLRSEKAAWNTK